MKDDKGVYYYPDPYNHNVKMYVRENARGEIEFRLWQADYPEVWERHEWLLLDVVRQASEMYRLERNANADPMRLYDEKVAMALLKEGKRR